MIFFKDKLKILLSLALLCSLVVLSAIASTAADSSQLAATVKSIQALDSARSTVLQELESLPPGSQDAADSVDFVVYLNTRISMYCEELSQAGADALLEDLPCPIEEPSSAAQGLVGGGAEAEEPPDEQGSGTFQSSVAKPADLEGEFLKAMGVFDEMLAQEEGKMASRVPSQRESGGMGGSDGSSGASGQGGSGQAGMSSAGEGQGTQSGDGTEAGEMSGAEGAESGGMSGAMGSEAGGMSGGGDSAQKERQAAGVPGGTVPPPQDDDIVARQLREAAEKEQDPELKKKLWEEYWKYKGVVKKR